MKFLIDVLKSCLLVVVLLIISVSGLVIYMVWMPNPQQQVVDEAPDNSDKLKWQLKSHIEQLTVSPQGRNYIDKDTLTPAKQYIANEFLKFGSELTYQDYQLYGDTFSNIIINIPALEQTNNVLVVGAHYDTVENSPGANDNASGVAALIELGRYFSLHRPTKYNLRLIAFANEEPPYFQTQEMGSMVYTKSMPANENLIGMISLESLGFYTDQPNSQQYPKLFKYLYPEQGNFIAFVGNLQSRDLVTNAIKLFKKNSTVPAEGIASPAFFPGIAWSDHWSFWMHGERAIMITDTAPYRYQHYHKSTDTTDKLNYEQYSKVVLGIIKMIQGFVNSVKH